MDKFAQGSNPEQGSKTEATLENILKFIMSLNVGKNFDTGADNFKITRRKKDESGMIALDIRFKANPKEGKDYETIEFNYAKYNKRQVGPPQIDVVYYDSDGILYTAITMAQFENGVWKRIDPTEID